MSEPHSVMFTRTLIEFSIEDLYTNWNQVNYWTGSPTTSQIDSIVCSWKLSKEMAIHCLPYP